MTLDNSATKPSHLVAAPQSSGFEEMNENYPQELSINSNGQLNVVRKCSGRANQNSQTFTSNQLNDHIDSDMSCSTTDSKYGGDVNQPFIHNIHTVISQQAETMRSITESEKILRDFINDSNEILKKFMEHRSQHEGPAHPSVNKNTLDLPDSRHKRKPSEGVNSLAHSRGSLTPSNDENGTLEQKKPGTWKERLRASFRRKKNRRPSENEAGEVHGNSAGSKNGKGKKSSGFFKGIRHSLRRRSSSGITHENVHALIPEQPLALYSDQIDSLHESLHESDSEGPMEAEMPSNSGSRSLNEVDAGVLEKPGIRRFLSIDGNEGSDVNQKKFNEMSEKEKEVLYEKIAGELIDIGDKEVEARIQASIDQQTNLTNYENFYRLIQGAISGSGDNLLQEMAVLCSVTAVTVSRVGEMGTLMYNRYIRESIAPRVAERGGLAALGSAIH